MKTADDLEIDRIERAAAASRGPTQAVDTTGDVKTNPDIYSSDHEIAIMRAANDSIDGMGCMQPSLSTALSVAMRRNLTVPSEVAVTSAKHVIGIALDSRGRSNAFKTALAEAKTIHDRYQLIIERIQQSINPKQEYQRLIDDATSRVLTGDATALDNLEPEKDIETRFAAERHALEKAVWKLGRDQMQHALIARAEIDAALSDLARQYEVRDAEECKKFGVETQHSYATNLIHSVRVQFFRQSNSIPRLAKAHDDEPNGPNFKNYFADFLNEVADWA